MGRVGLLLRCCCSRLALFVCCEYSRLSVRLVGVLIRGSPQHGCGQEVLAVWRCVALTPARRVVLKTLALDAPSPFYLWDINAHPLSIVLVVRERCPRHTSVGPSFSLSSRIACMGFLSLFQLSHCLDVFDRFLFSRSNIIGLPRVLLMSMIRAQGGQVVYHVEVADYAP